MGRFDRHVSHHFSRLDSVGKAGDAMSDDERTWREKAYDRDTDNEPNRKPLNWKFWNTVLIVAFAVFAVLVIYSNFGQ
jgi:hypothetical protein